jgi:hypothetical protein
MKNNIEVTEGGSYIYRGDASNFHEWEFRTRLCLKAAGDNINRYAEHMSNVVDGMIGDAFVVAKEVGIDKLCHSGDAFTDPGVDVLIKAVKATVFPLTTHEAKELFRQFCKSSGSLARQVGESMQQYVGRRRRSWKLLQELDPELWLSEGHRADMLLDLAGLDKSERVMIQASIGNARDFDKIADALIVQHPRIHIRNDPTHQKWKLGNYRFGGEGGGKFSTTKELEAGEDFSTMPASESLSAYSGNSLPTTPTNASPALRERTSMMCIKDKQR